MNFQSLCEIKDEPCEVMYLGENGDFSTDLSSIISLVSHGPTNPEHSVKVKFEPKKEWNPVPQLPEKQHSSLYSQTEVVELRYAKPYTSLHSNCEPSLRVQIEPQKTWNPVPQLPEKQHNSSYSQPEKVKSRYAESNTPLHSNISMNYDHELSRENDSLINLTSTTLINPESSVTTQLEPKKTWNPVPQLPEKQNSSLYSLSEVELRNAKPYTSLHSNSEPSLRVHYEPQKPRNPVPQLSKKQQNSSYSQPEEVKSSYAESNTSLHSNISMNYDNGLSSGNESLINLPSTALLNPEYIVITQVEPKKVWNPILQLPEKQHSSLYSQSEKNNSSYDKSYTSLHSKSSINHDHGVSKVQDFPLDAEIYPECAAITQLEPITRNAVPQISDKQHSSLYSQSEQVNSSFTKSYTSVYSNISVNYDNELSNGNGSLRNLTSKTLINPEGSVITQFVPKKTWNPILQIPDKQHSSLYSQSEQVNSSYAKSYTSINSNSSMDHDHELSSGNDSLQNLTSKTLINPEGSVITQFEPKKTWNPILQLPDKQHSSLYSQSEQVNSSYAKPYTSIDSNSRMDHDHGISSGKNSVLDLTYTTLRTDIPPLIEIQPSSLYSQPEVDKSRYTKSHTSSHSNSSMDYEHEVSSGNDAPLDLTCTTSKNAERCQQKKKQTSMPDSSEGSTKNSVDMYKRIKEQNKKRSTKYRLNYKERLKQNEVEYDTLKEKNILLQAKFIRLKQQWDRLVSVSPCFTGGCAKTFQPKKHILRTRFDDKLEKILANKTKTDKCKCNGQRMCETNKCSCFKTARECTEICQKTHLCSNHFL